MNSRYNHEQPRTLYLVVNSMRHVTTIRITIIFIFIIITIVIVKGLNPGVISKVG